MSLTISPPSEKEICHVKVMPVHFPIGRRNNNKTVGRTWRQRSHMFSNRPVREGVLDIDPAKTALRVVIGSFGKDLSRNASGSIDPTPSGRLTNLGQRSLQLSSCSLLTVLLPALVDESLNSLQRISWGLSPQWQLCLISLVQV